MAAPRKAGGGEPHRARALLKEFGIGTSTIGDRSATTAAYGDRALTVPSPDGKSQHAVWATKDITDVDGLAAKLLVREHGSQYQPSPDEIAAQAAILRGAGGASYSDDAALLAQAHQQQNLVNQLYFQRMEGAEALIDKAKADEAFRARVAPMMGFSPAPEPAPVGKPAAAAVEAAAANPGAVNPEVDNWWTASAPELSDVPVLKEIPRYGLVGAGAIGAGALAYHLMATGQQQQDPAAYAATVQAMNAY